MEKLNAPVVLPAGASLALVSDAGTPGVSDPGSLLVAAAAEAGVRVVPVPARKEHRICSHQRLTSTFSFILLCSSSVIVSFLSAHYTVTRNHPQGPSALLAALVASGLPTTSVLFAGFLPPKATARKKRLASLGASASTVVLYVPPHKLTSTLDVRSF